MQKLFMKLKYLIYFFSIFLSSLLYAQDTKEDFTNYKNGITKHNTLSIHPFGILFNRLQGNFREHTSKKPTIQLSIESANLFSQPLIVYSPNSEAVRNEVRQVRWFETEFRFDVDEIAEDAQRIDIAIDGVYKSLRGNFSFPINSNQELNIGARAFLLTDGRFPFSFFTGDEFIEWFHSNITNDEDPFGRRANGLNQARISYTDRNGNSFEINNNQALFAGIETSYYYYPESFLKKVKNLSTNFGSHLGVNFFFSKLFNRFWIICKWY